jgi:uncharacterized protein (DUF362 family)/NAD-dependent dihydropyrimidine dehydrogenase PreA subunit
MANTVAIKKCNSYDIDRVYEALKELCPKANMPDVSGKKVLLKPNILSDARPEAAITTNPTVVRAMIRILKENGVSEIYVGDSPGLHTPAFTAKHCGIRDVVDEEGAIWCDFTDSPVTKRLAGMRLKLPMAAILEKVDLVFSLCKFKSHTLMYATGATKNLFGTIPNVNKALCHAKYPSRDSFAKVIIGIHETIKPSFCVMDGIIGMEGAGPANGTPRAMDLLLASDSCLAMDIAQATIMGYRIEDIPILREAKRRHLLPDSIDYPLLDAKNLVIDDFERIEIKRTNLFKALLLPFLTSRFQRIHQRKEPEPVFNDDLCIRCQRCINICPQKALSLVPIENSNSKHVICDLTKCIRCYCCHEMCPVNAITVGGKND